MSGTDTTGSTDTTMTGPSGRPDAPAARTPAIDGDISALQRSERDTTVMPQLLADWIAERAGARPDLTIDAGIDANGMSSETIMIDAQWPAGATERWVMRMAPRTADIPVFDEYRLDHQYEVMRQVSMSTDVPVPPLRWLDDTGRVLGSPFFLMDRVDGFIPPDVMPYTFGDNWLFDATTEAQRALQDSTVELLASLHRAPVAPVEFLRPAGSTDTDLRRHLTDVQRWYQSSVGLLGRSPLTERALSWLAAHFPDEIAASESVLCWGDSRIGNVIYRDFTPAAVLDWEMAGLGPRELDVSWLIFAHAVFQELCGLAGLPGMPDFLVENDVRDTYRRASGVELGDLTWFWVYAGTVWCCVFLRAGARRVHFGEIAAPVDIDAELFYHRTLLERLLDNAETHA